MLLRRAYFTLIFLQVVGCGGDPYSTRYARREPTRSDLVGTWALDDQAHNLDNPGTPSLSLLDDGSFEAKGFPGEAIEGRGVKGSHHNGSGVWALEQLQGRWIINLRWQVLDGAPLDSSLPVDVLNDAPHHRLHWGVGDPDSGEGLTFVKP
jgi:hypothetical protein